MDIYVGLLASFCLLVFSVLKNIYLGYTLLSCLFIFVLVAINRGHHLPEVIKMIYDGEKRSFVVIKVLVIIGGVIGIWMASGTIPAIVYYCLKFITPDTFILSAFLICSLTSFLIGTAVGTVSTVGIPLIIIAQNGNVSLNITAGAILAGAYFGDRCSPMSSSAALVSNLTKTDLFINIKNMMITSIIPFLMTLIIYLVLSLSHPLKALNDNLSIEILKAFNINFIMLIPAIIILILSLLKVRITYSIPLSILVSSILCIILQGETLRQVLYDIIFGFRMNSLSPLHDIIKGGGIVSMLKTSLVVFVSCSIAGIFQGINVFESLKKSLFRMKLSDYRLFGATSIISLATAAFGCTQSIAVIMTREILNDCYMNEDKYQFSIHLENSGILLSPLIPWNIAALVPTTALNVSPTGFIPYACYLYILPILYFIYLKYFKEKAMLKTKLKQYSA